MNRKISLPLLFIIMFTISTPSHAFFGKVFEPLTEMIKQAGGVANNIIDTGGESFGEMVKLTSKLSDDIGAMANRILKMADKIGEMADRIVKTERMMAELMTTLSGHGADGNLSSEITERLERIEAKLGSIASSVVLLSQDDFASVDIAPNITMTDNPKKFLLSDLLN